MSNIAVELKNVVKIYKLAPGLEIEALKGVNLKVNRGEYISIMGPSGSGKTTLLNIIGTMDKPTFGRVIIDEIDVTDMSEKELSDFRCNRIGYLFQFFNLISTLNALENVMLPMILSGKYTEKEAQERAIKLLQLVGTEEKIFKNRPVQMSGGERQRVALARALANEPALILMDEPTGSLDTATGAKVMKLTKVLNEYLNQTFIVVTHNPSVAMIANKMFYIRDGKIFENPPKELLSFDIAMDEKEKYGLLSSQLKILRHSIYLLEERLRRGDINYDSYNEIKKKIIEQIDRIEIFLKGTS
jgi:putative ABC transport system ATP-binding protein